MLFNKFREKQVWNILQIDVESSDIQVVGYIVDKAAGELLCNAANEYTGTTRVRYELSKS